MAETLTEAEDDLDEGERQILEKAGVKPNVEDRRADKPEGGVFISDEELADPKDGKAKRTEGGEADGGDERLNTTERGESQEQRQARRREERHQQKQKRREYVGRLERENREFRERLERLEQGQQHLTGRQHTATLSEVESRLSQAKAILEQGEAELAEAIKNGDGAAGVAARRKTSTAERAIDALERFKAQATQKQPQRQEQRQEAKVAPEAQRLGSKWMRSNDWFDPNLGNTDSKIAKVIEEEMLEEGGDQTDPEFWDEFTDRVRERLPHRFKDDDRGERRNGHANGRELNGNGRSSPPAGSGRGSPQQKGFWVSPERVAALKEAGRWDDPELRRKAIEAFKKYDAEHGEQRS